jgi:hypothetical protein
VAKPDHFARPVQSDRTLHHYGHTKLERDDEFTLAGLVRGMLACGLLATAAYFAIIAFSAAR